jgi:DNA-binding PucR family transcriptional regulator
VLYDLDCQNPYLVLRDPGEDLRDELLLGLLRDRGAVVGPAVPPTMAPDSLRWARRLRDRLPAPALAKAPIMCDHALPSVLLLGDEPLLKLLADRRLAALADLTVKQRRRMETTLLAWLDTNGGSAPQIAARLGIHPQTARQRLHRLHELFGPVFADPDARFELELALRGRHALSALGRQQ